MAFSGEYFDNLFRFQEQIVFEQAEQTLKRGLDLIIARHTPGTNHLILLIWKQLILGQPVMLSQIAAHVGESSRDCLTRIKEIAGIEFNDENNIISCYGLTLNKFNSRTEWSYETNLTTLFSLNTIYSTGSLMAAFASILLSEPVIIFYEGEFNISCKWSMTIRNQSIRVRPSDNYIFISHNCGDFPNHHPIKLSRDGFDCESNFLKALIPARGFYRMKVDAFSQQLLEAAHQFKASSQ